MGLLPEIAYPKLAVYTSYPNVAPTEVEELVTKPIERGVSAVPGVERMESVSREGTSMVTVRFAWGTDMDFAALNVRQRLDNLRGLLPDRATRPAVLTIDPGAEPVLSISVTTRRDFSTLRDVAESVVRRRLEQIDGVAQAVVVGGLEREIHVEVDRRKLESVGLSIDDVARALDAANTSVTGGTVLQGQYRYALRTLSEFQSVSEIELVPVRPLIGRPPDGSAGSGPGGGDAGPRGTVLLRDVARVDDGFRDRESLARFNGEDAIGLLVFKDSEANTVRVAEQVTEALEQLQRAYPEMRLNVAASQAGFISDAIANVVQDVVLGGTLAFLVLLLFLRDLRYSVAIAIAMPISIIATFALFDAFDITLNVMTLGGLALSVGLLLDNSIVVVENIFRNRELGLPMHDAAATGTEQVQRAVIGSTLSSIAVFAPIIYLEGVAGRLFGALSYAVAAALLSTIVIALVLLPVLASRWSRHDRRSPWGAVPPLARTIAAAVHSVVDRFHLAYARFEAAYERVVVICLAHRARVIAGSVLLLGVAVVLGSTLKRSVLPDVDQGAFQIRITLPQGTPFAQTAVVTERVEHAVRSDADVAAIFSRVGRAELFLSGDEREAGINSALIDVRLNDGVRSAEAVRRLRPKLDAFPPGVITIQAEQATAVGRLLGGGESDLVVRVYGEDIKATLAHARTVADRLAPLVALANVRVGTADGHPEVRIEIDRERAAAYGVTPGEIARVIETSMRGVVATEFVDFDRTVGIVVRLPEDDRHSAATLRELRVRDVPLREFLTTQEADGPTEIRRIDQSRMVAVMADVAASDLDQALDETREVLRKLPQPTGIRAEIGGESEEMQRAFRALAFAFGLAIVLVYMVLAAEFESLVLPFIVLFSIPLGLVGAIIALWLTGAGLNAVSVIGLIVLAGIADNDAVIKVDFINQARRNGRSVRAAILEAGRARLRPIVINSATTMLGLLPLALGLGPGAELQAPLAVAIFGGLFTATGLTLIVIPVAYDLSEEARVRLQRIARAPTAAPLSPGEASGTLGD